METRANFILVGATALIGVALILIFSAWMIGGEWRTGVHVYDVVFDGPVRGLADGGEVRYNGIKVGEVKSLRVDEKDPARIVARVQVSATTPLRRDSHAELEAVGITGVTLVQLFPGSRAAPLLVPKAGRPPPRLASGPSTIDVLLTRDNAQRLSEILVDLKSISGQLAREDSVLAESARAARALSEASRGVAVLSHESQLSITRLTERGDRALTSLDDAAFRAALAFERLEGAALVAEGQSLPQITKAASSLQRAAETFDETVTELNRNPSGYLTGKTRPRIKLPE